MDEKYLDSYIAMMEAYREKKGAVEDVKIVKPNAPSECPYCDGSGYMIVEKTLNGYKFQFMQKCQCFGEAQKKVHLENSNLPKAFLSKTFDGFEATDITLQEAKERAMEYVENYSRNCPSIYFNGIAGSGKTHLCVAICNAVIDKGAGVQYMLYREAVTVLMQYKYKHEEYKREIDKYKHADLLYIDDLFKGRPSQDEKNIIYEILDYRSKAELPVIISCIMSLSALRELDSGIYQRIYDMCRTGSDLNVISLGSAERR